MLEEIYLASREGRIAARRPQAVAVPLRPVPRRSTWLSVLFLVLLVFPLLGAVGYAFLLQEPLTAKPVAASADLATEAIAQLLSAPRQWQGTPPTAPPAPASLMPPEPGAEAGSTERYLAMLGQPGIELADLFGLGVRTIVIDPGHGGRDPGATGPGGVHEKDITLDLAMRLRERLRASGGFRVMLTREDDVYASLKDRVAFANAKGADLFISIHINALPVEKPTVIETYYFGPQTDNAALEVARTENEGSDYVMAEFRDMVKRFSESFRHQESRRLARHIQASLYRHMKRENESVKSWGVKSAPFVVLLGADMPSVLTEVTTLTNRREESRLATPEYRERIVRYLEQGIVQYLGAAGAPRGPTIGAERNGKYEKERNTSKEG